MHIYAHTRAHAHTHSHVRLKECTPTRPPTHAHTRRTLKDSHTHAHTDRQKEMCMKERCMQAPAAHTQNGTEAEHTFPIGPGMQVGVSAWLLPGVSTTTLVRHATRRERIFVTR